jgi:hypothetical protein
MLVVVAPAMRPMSATRASPIAAQPGICRALLKGIITANGGLFVGVSMGSSDVTTVGAPPPPTSIFSSISAFRKTGVLLLSSREAT